MFLGHFALGFAAKPVAPRVSLGTLFLATQLIDLMWPTLLLLGLETVAIVPGATALTPLEFIEYPISHSLVAVLAWGVLFAGIYYALRRWVVGAVVCGALVVSHWLLDLLTHAPDLPLAPGGFARVGLGLWNHPALAIGVELTLFVVGLGLYLRATRARDGAGRVILGALVAFLLLVHLSNLFGPPPPSVQAIAWVGQAQWLLVAWGYWADWHREAVR